MKLLSVIFTELGLNTIIFIILIWRPFGFEHKQNHSLSLTKHNYHLCLQCPLKELNDCKYEGFANLRSILTRDYLGSHNNLQSLKLELTSLVFSLLWSNLAANFNQNNLNFVYDLQTN